MKQLVFALQFRGSAAPVESAEGKVRPGPRPGARLHRMAIGISGVQGTVVSAGGTATFESDVQMVGGGAQAEPLLKQA